MAKNTQKAAAYYRKGVGAIKTENFGIARTMLAKAIELDKDHTDAMMKLGHVLIATGHASEALEVMQRCVKRRPNQPDSLLLLAQAHMELGEIDRMHAALDKALAWDPTHGVCLHAKVIGYLGSNQPELAQEVLDRVRDLENPHTLVLMARAKLARALKQPAQAVDHLSELLARENVIERYRRSARFELGHCYDAMGEYDKAFELFRLANAGHDAQGKVLHAGSMIQMWSRELLNSIPAAQTGSERPVFVVGMPRSGTTLTEQILLAHPDVEGVGECPLIAHQLLRKSPTSLTGEDVESYAQEYLAYLDERVGASSARVIDKHMGAERTLGLISRMFPGARVIHCLRDPLDSCLSAYFQNFGTNVSYSRDLTQLGKQYVAHRELMDHWARVLDLPIMPSPYEELVADFEPRARAIVDHVGLDFDERCLRFHESRQHVGTASSVQVRSPIYRSSAQRWRHYERHIGPLIEALGPYAQTDHASQGA